MEEGRREKGEGNRVKGRRKGEEGSKKVEGIKEGGREIGRKAGRGGERGASRREPYNKIESVSTGEGCVPQCLDNRYVRILHLCILPH